MAKDENLWVIVGAVVVILLLWFMFCRGDPGTPEPTPTPTVSPTATPTFTPEPIWDHYFKPNVTVHRGESKTISFHWCYDGYAGSPVYNVVMAIYDSGGYVQYNHGRIFSSFQVATEYVLGVPVNWFECLNMPLPSDPNSLPKIPHKGADSFNYYMQTDYEMDFKFTVLPDAPLGTYWLRFAAVGRYSEHSGGSLGFEDWYITVLE